MKSGRVCGTWGGGRRGACTVSVGNPEGKRPLGRHRHRWEDNIKIDVQVVEWEGMDGIGLAQDRKK
jgi:hypothetical protein